MHKSLHLPSLMTCLVAICDEQGFRNQLRLRRRGTLFRIFSHHIDFNVYLCSRLERMQVGGRVGVRDDGDGDSTVFVDLGYRKRDALDGDGSLLHDVALQRLWRGDGEMPIGLTRRFGLEGGKGEEFAYSIDVALDDVSAEGRACCCRQFEVDRRSGCKMQERGTVNGLECEVGREAWRLRLSLDIECGKTDSADCDAVARVQMRCQSWSGDGDTSGAFSGGESDDIACLGDESGEHSSRVA